MTLADFLGRAEVFIHGTTRAINAILTDTTARTALLDDARAPRRPAAARGRANRSVQLELRLPRRRTSRAALTFEIAERIGSQGEIVQPLDERAARRGDLERLAELAVEAVAVCLLWSIANPAHELALGELLERHLPGVPYTLSHALNPTLREYRRASSTAIDASLKPLMTSYLRRPRGAPARAPASPGDC